MGAQGQLTQGTIMRNPRTKYKRSKNIFAVTSIALIIGRDNRLVFIYFTRCHASFRKSEAMGSFWLTRVRFSNLVEYRSKFHHSYVSEHRRHVEGMSYVPRDWKDYFDNSAEECTGTPY